MVAITTATFQWLVGTFSGKLQINKMVNACYCEKDFLLSSSSSAEELEQNVDVLLLDQDMCQSQYADSQRFEEAMSKQQLCSKQFNFQSLSLG